MSKVYSMRPSNLSEWVMESPYGQGWQACRYWHTSSAVHIDARYVAATLTGILGFILRYEEGKGRSPGEYLDMVSPDLPEDVKAECLLHLAVDPV